MDKGVDDYRAEFHKSFERLRIEYKAMKGPLGSFLAINTRDATKILPPEPFGPEIVPPGKEWLDIYQDFQHKADGVYNSGLKPGDLQIIEYYEVLSRFKELVHLINGFSDQKIKLETDELCKIAIEEDVS